MVTKYKDQFQTAPLPSGVGYQQIFRKGDIEGLENKTTSPVIYDTQGNQIRILTSYNVLNARHVGSWLMYGTEDKTLCIDSLKPLQSTIVFDSDRFDTYFHNIEKSKDFRGNIIKVITLLSFTYARLILGDLDICAHKIYLLWKLWQSFYEISKSLKVKRVYE